MVPSPKEDDRERVRLHPFVPEELFIFLLFDLRVPGIHASGAGPGLGPARGFLALPGLGLRLWLGL